jgi:electron transfer flavoprotein beta subunit
MVPDMDMVVADDWNNFNDNNEPEIGYTNKIINCFDESALELALRLADSNQHDAKEKVCVVTIADDKSDKMMQTIMSLGVHAIRIEDKGTFKNNPHALAAIIQKVICKSGSFDAILFGAQAGEYDNGQTGLITAEMLGLPCITEVTYAVEQKGLLVVTHQTDYGIETLYTEPPVVLIVGNAQDVTLRIPTLKEKLAAKNNKIETFSLDYLDLDRDELIKMDQRIPGRLFFEKTKRQCFYIEGTDSKEKAEHLYREVLRNAICKEA